MQAVEKFKCKTISPWALQGDRKISLGSQSDQQNTISQLLGFQTHTQDMHQSLFCISSLSTNLGTLKRKIPFHNISLLNYTGKISWLTWTTPNCTFSFCQNFLNHWKCYRVMTLLIWISFTETATKISKNFVDTLQVQNYCHKYGLQANKLWLQ